MWRYQLLRELSTVLDDSSPIRSFQRMFLITSRRGTTARYAEGIRNSTMDSDTDAIHHLYGESARRYVFRTFKSRFAEDLLSCYLTVETDDELRSSTVFTKYRLRVYYLAAVVLSWSGRTLLAVRVLQHGLDLALKSDFSDMLFLYTNMLSELSRSVDQRNEHSIYMRMTGVYLRRWQSEYIIADAIHRDDIMTRSDRGHELTRDETLEQVLDRLSAINKDHIPRTAQLGSIRIMSRLSAAKGDLQAFKQYQQQIDTHLADQPETCESDHLALETDRSLAYAQLRMMHDVVSVESQTEPSVDAPWWFAWHASRIVAYIHLGRYEEAVRRWNTADATHYQYFEVQASADAPWRLIGGYIALLEAMDLTGSERRDRPFRMTTFLNSLPNPLQQDLRSGLPYLILEIAFAITKFDYDLAARRIEAGNISLVRTSHKHEYRRFMLFWQLIRLIYNKRFDVASIRQSATPYLRELAEDTSEPLPSLIAEVIPYDQLFEFLLQAMYRNELHEGNEI